MNITFLDKIISNDEFNDDKQPVLGMDTNEDTRNQVNSFEDRIILLGKVNRNHQLLTVELENSDAQYSSMILEVNAEGSYMVLDEFYPTPPPGAVFTNRKIKFYTFLSGVQLDVVSTIEAVSETAVKPFYKIPIPEKIFYYQNRQYLRVPVSISNPIRIVLSDDESAITNGEIRDLSAGGFSARLKLIDQKFDLGEIIENCILYMPGDRKIYCSIEIRQSDPGTSTTLPKIGACFRELRKNDQRTIERYVAEVDRELTRRFRR